MTGDCASKAGGRGSIPGQGTKLRMLQGRPGAGPSPTSKKISEAAFFFLPIYWTHNTPPKLEMQANPGLLLTSIPSMGPCQSPWWLGPSLAQWGFIFADFICPGSSSDLESGDAGVSSDSVACTLCSWRQVTLRPFKGHFCKMGRRRQVPPAFSGGFCVRAQ